MTSPYQGLDDAEAKARLARHGENVLASSKPRSLFQVALGTVREPMFLLLLSCGVLYLFLGDLGEAALISAAVLAVIGITIVQERRTERTLDALKDLSSPRALVIRGGVEKRIAGKEVVPGDLVVIAEGDRVPADGFVVDEASLKVNESLLTGESVPVDKVPWNGTDEFLAEAGGDDRPFVYSGTLVVQGTGRLLVHATGQATAMGRIGRSLGETERPPSLLQAETRRVVRIVAASSILVSVAVALVWWLRERELVRGILMGITFAMSTIPEEFPVVLTIFLALGAWRISKRNVLTRQMSAIETLGSATTLCVDKTGTLTENRMTLAVVWPGAKSDADRERELVRLAARASDPAGKDPMDVASVARYLAEQPVGEQLRLVRAFPLVRPVLAVGYAWQGATDRLLAIKGAPETVLDLCGTSGTERLDVLAAVQRLAKEGFRVLAVAESREGDWETASGLDAFRPTFKGLLGYQDPLKPGVADAVRQCHEAGIAVVMITGDYPATALAIAGACGIDTRAGALTGGEIGQLSDERLIQRLKQVRVLARMVPEQKLRIVRALQDDGQIVAMTGDGVNDAPALKAAHIGIAMGNRGTDVAREAAALVLLDDNFTSIVGAIRLGRRIYDNVQRAVIYIIAIHVPIVGLSLLPLAFGAAQVLWPVHLAFLELIIDPVCSIVFEAEPESDGIMRRPPRAVNAHLFGKKVVASSILQGLIALLAVIAVFLWIGKSGEVPDHARAVAFTALILIDVALILSIRTGTEPFWRKSTTGNAALLPVGAGLLVVSAAVLFVPPVARIFHFVPPHAADVAAAAGFEGAILVLLEGAKRLMRS